MMRRRRSLLVLAALSASGFALGCRRSSAPPVPPARVGITWVDPLEFRRVTPTTPRRATYVVPRAAGETEDGDLAVFHVGPGDDAGVDAHIDRWVAPFSAVDPRQVKRVDRDVGGLHLRMIEIPHGTFDAGQASAGAAAQKRDYALEGAIVEVPGNAYLFRLIGPARTVAAARPAFEQLLESMRIVRPER
jgi:hypothetical protein